jgi:hypothetical protein
LLVPLEEANMTEHENGAPPPALPWQTAALIISAMIGAVLMGALPVEIAPAFKRLKELNPWWDTTVGQVSIWLLLAITLRICLKQLGYYYARLGGGSDKAGVFQTVKAHSALEYTLDWILAILGASLFVVAWYYTPVWLFAFALYCLVAWYRCKVTLSRPAIVETVTRTPARGGLFDRYLGRLLPPSPTVEQTEQHFQQVAQSLNQPHGPRGIPVKFIFAGWLWSFPINCVVASSAFLFSCLFFVAGKTVWSIYVSLIGLLALLTTFFGLSARSLRRGEQTADGIIGGLFKSQSTNTVRVSCALVLAGIAGTILMFGRGYLAAQYIQFKVRRLEQQIGMTVEFKAQPPGMMEGTVVSYMTPVWRSTQFNAEGNNYWKIGWSNGTGSSTRFDPTSKYYQAWLGAYMARSKSFEAFPSDFRRYPIEVIGQLALLDQIAWLRLYADPSPKAELTRWEPIGPLTISGRQGYLYYGEIESHSDVSQQTTRYIELFPRAYRGERVAPDVLTPLFVPKYDIWSRKVAPHHSVLLRGYFAVVPIPERQAVICIYANGVRTTLLDGTALDTFSELEPEFMKAIRSVEFVRPGF